MKTLLLLLMLTPFATPRADAAELVRTEPYGRMPDGRETQLFTLRNRSGIEVRVAEFGATLVSVKTPDRHGRFADITHGYDGLEGWMNGKAYFGATIGRFGNRIRDGRFTLDGQTYTLAKNNEPGGIPCHLHGGTMGFNKVLWRGVPVARGADAGVEFTYVSRDGEEGYPGTLTSTVTYWLTDGNELRWEVSATTDRATIVNFAHHSYWNLTGDPKRTINDHELTLNADLYLPTDKGLIPTGEIAAVAGTPMDFTRPTKIGARLAEKFTALEYGLGYDHAWVLRSEGAPVRLAARVRDPESGRTLEVETDQTAIQFYGGNFLDGTEVGKGGTAYQYRTAFCLETEGFPAAPNHRHFPSAVLRPGETYRHVMVHRFGVEK